LGLKSRPIYIRGPRIYAPSFFGKKGYFLSQGENGQEEGGRKGNGENNFVFPLSTTRS